MLWALGAEGGPLTVVVARGTDLGFARTLLQAGANVLVVPAPGPGPRLPELLLRRAGWPPTRQFLVAAQGAIDAALLGRMGMVSRDRLRIVGLPGAADAAVVLANTEPRAAEVHLVEDGFELAMRGGSSAAVLPQAAGLYPTWRRLAGCGPRAERPVRVHESVEGLREALGLVHEGGGLAVRLSPVATPEPPPWDTSAGKALVGEAVSPRAWLRLELGAQASEPVDAGPEPTTGLPLRAMTLRSDHGRALDLQQGSQPTLRHAAHRIARAVADFAAAQGIEASEVGLIAAGSAGPAALLALERGVAVLVDAPATLWQQVPEEAPWDPATVDWLPAGARHDPWVLSWARPGLIHWVDPRDGVGAAWADQPLGGTVHPDLASALSEAAR